MTVADASAVLEMLLRTPLGERCADRLLRPGETLWAPSLLDVEIAQVLRRFAAKGDLADLPLTRFSHEPLLGRIWDLRHSLSAYDAAYVALSEALEAPIASCDGRLTRSHGHRAMIEVISE